MTQADSSGSNTATIFDKKMATSYDDKNDNIAAIKDALHLCIRIITLDLPIDARILCVGAGTGAELFDLAAAYPNWTFTVVEPAPEMMQRCQQKAQELAVTSRCHFHLGYLDSLSEQGLFDAATSILVMHFIADEALRIEYLTNIRQHLKPSGILINADLASNLSPQMFDQQLRVWNNMKAYAGMPIHGNAFGQYQKLATTEKIEALITAAGFDNPILFYQAFLIHAWFSTKIKPLI